MALQLNYETKSGFICNYWVVDTIDMNRVSSVGHCTVVLYKDKAARDAGKSPEVVRRVEQWSGADYPFTIAAMGAAGQDPYKIVYNKIKALPKWNGAVDV